MNWPDMYIDMLELSLTEFAIAGEWWLFRNIRWVTFLTSPSKALICLIFPICLENDKLPFESFVNRYSYSSKWSVAIELATGNFHRKAIPSRALQNHNMFCPATSWYQVQYLSESHDTGSLYIYFYVIASPGLWMSLVPKHGSSKKPSKPELLTCSGPVSLNIVPLLENRATVEAAEPDRYPLSMFSRLFHTFCQASSRD